MIKVEKISYYEYVDIVQSAIQQFGFRICSYCKRATIPIKRQHDNRFYYYENIKSCDDHAIFDLIFANTTEQRKLFLNDRRN